MLEIKFKHTHKKKKNLNEYSNVHAIKENRMN